MKNLSFRRILLLLALAQLLSVNARSQSFYYRLEVGASNLYAFAASNLVTAGINAFSDKMLFDNQLNFNLLQSPTSQLGRFSIIGMTGDDMLQNISFGTKLGCVQHTAGFVGWGLFATVHYQHYRFYSTENEEICPHRLHSLPLGVGGMLLLGGLSSETKVVLEAGLRYDIPLAYSGVWSETQMKGGLSTRLALRCNGTSALQGWGAFVEIPHYSVFPETTGNKLKIYNFGLIYTITPWKIKGY